MTRAKIIAKNLTLKDIGGKLTREWLDDQLHLSGDYEEVLETPPEEDEEIYEMYWIGRLIADLQDRVDVKPDAEIFVRDEKGIEVKIKSMSFDLDDWDDSGWRLEAEEYKGDDWYNNDDVGSSCYEEVLSLQDRVSSLHEYRTDLTFEGLVNIIIGWRDMLDMEITVDIGPLRYQDILYKPLGYDIAKNRVYINIEKTQWN